MSPNRLERARTALRVTLALVYMTAGIGHLWFTDKFLTIVPDWVPAPRAVVLVTGVCEIAGATALFAARWRRLAGMMLALYAVCVFPANIKHAFGGVEVSPWLDGWWYHAPRLAFQPAFVWWALFAANVIDWPIRKSSAPR
jgi:uncharacterized membrane protein